MNYFFRIFLSFVFIFSLAHCGTTDSATNSSTATTGIRLTGAADFTSSASANLVRAVTTGQCSDLTNLEMDDPILTDGLDCDGDGGIVGHVTPSRYTLAIKRISLLSDDGSPTIDLIEDTQTLTNSEVINFTTSDSSETMITIDPADLSAGTYTGLEVELYYFQLTFPVGGTTRNVRIYMSDDDFASQGSLGHHQGDITFIDDNGAELGWVDDRWNDNLSSTRGEAQNGAGRTDEQTGHDRGFFGDQNLWNATDQNQGAGQDIFVTGFDFSQPLTIPDPATITNLTTITATFSVADTFYYEDFAPQGTGFFPGSGGEAACDGCEWAPLAPTAEITVTEN